MTTIRGQTTIVQTNNQVPALHPVSGTTIITSGAQVREENYPLFCVCVPLFPFYSSILYVELASNKLLN